MFGSIAGYFFGVSSIVAVIITGIIVTIYSAFGGIKSVTYTDFIQFIAFSCLIPLLGIIIWDHTYDTNFSLTQALQDPKLIIEKL